MTCLMYFGALEGQTVKSSLEICIFGALGVQSAKISRARRRMHEHGHGGGHACVHGCTRARGARHALVF